MNIIRLFGVLIASMLFLSCWELPSPFYQTMSTPKQPDSESTPFTNPGSSQKQDTATFGAGCFWCVEAIFQQIKGVDTAISGYMGGRIAQPTYKEVCSGLTGHVEVVQIVFDPSVVSFEQLLEVFWKTHDPTSPNRQGADEGTQYRSVVFYHSNEQKETAEKIKAALNASKIYDAPVITGVEAASVFYQAEDYHQNYFRENGDQPYCRAVVQPKVEKFEKLFKGLIR